MTRLYLGAPNPRQREFLLARQRFVAYGGARGGGKSWAVRTKAVLLALRYAGIRILILRRSFPELLDNHIRPLRLACRGIGAYRETEKAIALFNGSRIRFGYCASEADTDQYQGQEYDVVFIDEATQFSEMQYQKLTACLRGVNGFPKRMYLTCNPGGVGHAWVKRLFIDRDFREGENPDDYIFIPARVSDNTALLANDVGYVQMLEALPPDLRRAWLDGDWDALAGQYFAEFRRDLHVVEPFEIPAHWRRYFAMDYGLDMLAGYWAAFDERGRCYVYREIYRSGLIVSEAARMVRELSKGETIEAFLAPSDLWGRMADTGKSQAERYAQEGLYLQQVVARSRVDGWMDLHEWLKPRPLPAEEEGSGFRRCGQKNRGSEAEEDFFGNRERARPLPAEETGAPALRIFSTCRNLIRCLPLLQHDAHNPNDCATEPHEITHAPDALRYLLAGRPAPTAARRPRQSDLPFALRVPRRAESGLIMW